MLIKPVDYLIWNVLPSAAEYESAEGELSRAYLVAAVPSAWESAGNDAKRKAANLAIAIDGLTDRCVNELKRNKVSIRASVDALCVWPVAGSYAQAASTEFAQSQMPISTALSMIRISRFRPMMTC